MRPAPLRPAPFGLAFAGGRAFGPPWLLLNIGRFLFQKKYLARQPGRCEQ